MPSCNHNRTILPGCTERSSATICINGPVSRPVIFKTKSTDMNDKQTNAKDTAFAGTAQQQLFARYGDPRVAGWENKWMALWHVQKTFPWFPKKSVYIHKDFAAKLQQALTVLEAKGLHQEIVSFDGCFNIRRVRGSRSVLSVHSWGAAIDLNAAANPLGSPGKWSEAFLQVMQQNGIYCGQLWQGRKDPMHFAIVNG